LQTARANGVEPYGWLRRALRDLPAAKTIDEIEVLLPWNVNVAQDVRPVPIAIESMGEGS
jgi:hypothetical protein